MRTLLDSVRKVWPAGGGSTSAAEEAEALRATIEQAYPEVRRLAVLAAWSAQAGAQLQPVQGVTLSVRKLLGEAPAQFFTWGELFAWASKRLRILLSTYARKRIAGPEMGPLLTMALEDLLNVEVALDRLESLDSAAASVVHLRFIAGLSNEEVAAVLGIPADDVKQDWEFARSWLYEELASPGIGTWIDDSGAVGARQAGGRASG